VKLRKALQEAIAREDYRAAAQARDQIRALEESVRRNAKTRTPEGGSAS
jgi:protein-arginine kinase activator protein McsA